MKNKIVTGILAGVAALFLALIVCASIMLPYWQITIDKFFLGQGLDLSDYDSEPSERFAVRLEEEGQVLLKNDGVLPLSASESAPARVSAFGIRAGNMKFTGSGSGGGDVTNAVQLDDGLAASSVEVYAPLFDWYQSLDETGNEGGFGDIGKDPNSAEVHPSVIDDELLDGAAEWSDTALYVIGRVGAEEGTLDANDLCLSENEEATLDYVTENYDKVILILNISNTWETGFIEGKGKSRNSGADFSKYADKIDAALWVGCPGLTGTLAIGKVLTGETDPSGRLADTYSYDVLSSPAAHNYDAVFFSDSKTLSYSAYSEGIYTGYKWYETAAYEGVIDYDDHSGNSTLPFTDEKLSEGVMYPFGYGLSYTTFDWMKEDASVTDGVVTIRVKVTNTGPRAGRDVVQAYYTPPYTDGGIEKAYVNLAGFAKTSVIQPNGSETVTISFPLEDMKSYDYDDANGNGFRGYELEAGDYHVRLLRNAHGWTETGTEDDLCYTVNVPTAIRYENDTATGHKVENRFGDQAGGLEYLSREDGFANLAVTRPDPERATTDFTDAQGNTDYVMRTQAEYQIPADEDDDYVQYEDYEVTLDDPITLDELTETEFGDPKWNEFVKQFTKSELATIIAKANFETVAVERLGVPYCLLSDGPSGVKSTYDGESCVCFPSAIVLASTWNEQLAEDYGAAVAYDAAAVGVSTWYAPSVNLHRMPFDSRCFEYYSECAVLTGRMAARVVKGARAGGLNCSVKHLILYGKGTFQWCDEQTMREYYLRPFEMCVKDGGALSMMSTSNLFGVFCGRSSELLNDVLRGEWGFKGFVTTDAAGPGMLITPSIRAGNDLWLASDTSFYKTLIKDKNIGVMQEAVKHYLFAVSRSSIAMGSDVSAADWSPAIVIMIITDVVSAVIVGVCVFFIVRIVKRSKNKSAKTDDRA